MRGERMRRPARELASSRLTVSAGGGTPPMYKLNLYPEYEHGQRLARRRVLLTLLLSAFLGLSAMLIAALTISSILLQERVAALRMQHGELAARVKSGGGQGLTEATPATAFLELRSARIDWAPKIAAVSNLISDDLILSEILGESERKRNTSRFEMLGTIRQNDSGAEAVSRFVERLKADRSVSADFQDVGVGYIKGSGSFRVVCRNPEKD